MSGLFITLEVQTVLEKLLRLTDLKNIFLKEDIE